MFFFFFALSILFLCCQIFVAWCLHHYLWYTRGEVMRQYDQLHQDFPTSESEGATQEPAEFGGHRLKHWCGAHNVN